MIPTLPESVLDRVRRHAKQESPRECCGLIVRTEAGWEVVEAQNLAREPEQSFALDGAAWRRAEELGRPAALYHSHVHHPLEFSLLDRAACSRTRLSWLLIDAESGRCLWCEPTAPEVGLVGRAWRWGIFDCWAVVRDAYQERGLQLPDWERPPESEFPDQHPTLLLDLARRFGFEPVAVPPWSGLLPYDLLVMRLHHKHPNHLALYLEGDEILHHLRHSLSRREPFRSHWRKPGRIVAVLRHPELS